MQEQAEHIYHSFLVRCWLTPPTTADEPPAWRFELQEVSAESEKHRFRNLDLLCAFTSAKLDGIVAEHSQVNQKGENL